MHPTLHVRQLRRDHHVVCRCMVRAADVPQLWRTAALQRVTRVPHQHTWRVPPILMPSICTPRQSALFKRETRMPPIRSLFGVGAPEALLVGVVALIVFGPKGLADAAKSLGATLRAFQPTIKEVVEVSQDIKGTLEKELGLDELRDAARMPVALKSRSAGDLVRSSSSMAGFAPDVDEDPDIEAKRKASAAAAWGGQSQSMDNARTSTEIATRVPETLTQSEASSSLDTLTVEQLEAELARRKIGSPTKPQQHNNA